jgi:hypothetical protein
MDCSLHSVLLVIRPNGSALCLKCLTHKLHHFSEVAVLLYSADNFIMRLSLLKVRISEGRRSSGI